MAEERKLTGYPSIDKPWLKYYSEEAINAPLPECTMYQYIRENNKDHLSDIALRYYGTKITYGELFENIKKTADALYSMGICAGDVVTIMSMHTPETIYAIYGINYIGAVANIVYMTLSEKEILHTLENTESKLFLVLDAALDRIETIKDAVPCPVVVLAVSESMPPHIKLVYQLKAKPQKHSFPNWKQLLARRSSTAESAADHVAPAVMVYTSGTTGEAKGVVLSNDALNAHSCQEIYANFGFGRGKTFLHILPPFVGFGVSHIHLALNAGVESYLWIDLNPEAIVNAFFKVRPTFFVGGPALIDTFLAHKSADLSRVSLFVGGGEALAETKEREINQYLSKCHSEAIYSNGYGMTETSSTLCCNTNEYNKFGSVGLPMPKTVVKVVDPEDFQELRYNEIGELWFQTPNMMSGYYHNEDATKKVLVRDKDGDSWIRTGDLGKVDEDGYVFIVGRIKRIEITRGPDGMAYKLFPLHIEETVESSDIVEKCAVIICDDDERIHAPVLYVTLKEGRERPHDRDTILEVCKKNLPVHEHPQAIQVLSSMPMTPSGKIDYQALEKMVKMETLQSST